MLGFMCEAQALGSTCLQLGSVAVVIRFQVSHHGFVVRKPLSGLGIVYYVNDDKFQSTFKVNVPGSFEG